MVRKTFKIIKTISIAVSIIAIVGTLLAFTSPKDVDGNQWGSLYVLVTIPMLVFGCIGYLISELVLRFSNKS